MATIYQLIAKTEGAIRENKEREESIRSEIDGMITRAERAGRTEMSDSEQVKSEALLREVEQLKSARKRMNAQLAEMRRVAAEEDESDRLTRISGPSLERKPRYDEVMRIGSEPRTYSRESDPRCEGKAFLADVAAAFRGSPEANERLARHQREERVNNPRYQERAAGDFNSTNASTAIMVPGYLLDEYAHKPAVARPFADSINHVNLPPTGMTIEIGRESTAISAGIQSGELAAVTGSNVAVTKASIAVQTASAWTNMSRQTIDRGEMTEQIVMSSMLDAMNGALEAQLIQQTTLGLWECSTQLAYTDASPTPANMHPYILQAASKVSQALLNRGKPNSVLMAPRRWFWYQSVVDAKWPVVGQQGVDAQLIGTSTNAGYDNGVQGRLPSGLDVYLSAAVPLLGAAAGGQTTGDEDAVFVYDRNNLHLYEAPGREVFIRAEQPNAASLGVLLVVYSYFAFDHLRYGATAIQRIQGTGTKAPTGF
jgi:hypothetical protein